MFADATFSVVIGAISVGVGTILMTTASRVASICSRAVDRDHLPEWMSALLPSEHRQRRWQRWMGLTYLVLGLVHLILACFCASGILG